MQTIVKIAKESNEFYYFSQIMNKAYIWSEIAEFRLDIESALMTAFL